jgi:addiction module RelE/StbE family toxin
MRQLVLSSRFKKNLKDFLHKHPDLETTLPEKLNLLQQNPHTASLKTHKLTGKLKSYWALSITYKYRLVFSIEKDAIYLLAIGTHDEVY